jgi:hypothetical protein
MRILDSIRRLAVISAALAVGSCATVFNGTQQELGFSSSPTGAKVSVNGQSLGVTPLVADLKRKNNHIVRIELEGFQPYETTLTRKVSGWVWGNILIGGLIGLAVDAISGGLYKLTPEQVAATLAAQPTAPIAIPKPDVQPVPAEPMPQALESHGRVFVFATLSPDPAWERIGSMSKASD